MANASTSLYSQHCHWVLFTRPRSYTHDNIVTWFYLTSTFLHSRQHCHFVLFTYPRPHIHDNIVIRFYLNIHVHTFTTTLSLGFIYTSTSTHSRYFPWVLRAGEDLPFEKRDVTMRKDKWVTDFYTVSQLLGKYGFALVVVPMVFLCLLVFAL